MAVSIQQLIQDRPPLIHVGPHEKLRRAADLMVEHDFSQLPVMESGQTFRGAGSMVTSDSILKAINFLGARSMTCGSMPPPSRCAPSRPMTTSFRKSKTW